MKNVRRAVFENLANFITTVGFILTAWLIILALTDGEFVVMFWLAAAVILTDFLDGKIARYFSIASKTGSALDRLRDKIFIVPITLILVSRYWPVDVSATLRALTGALVATVVVLEFFLFVSGFYGLAKSLDIRSNRWGKLKMGFESAAVFVWFGALALEEKFALDVFPLAVVLIDVALFASVFLVVKSIEGYFARWRGEG